MKKMSISARIPGKARFVITEGNANSYINPQEALDNKGRFGIVNGGEGIDPIQLMVRNLAPAVRQYGIRLEFIPESGACGRSLDQILTARKNDQYHELGTLDFNLDPCEREAFMRGYVLGQRQTRSAVGMMIFPAGDSYAVYVKIDPDLPPLDPDPRYAA
jgi:hypothetical protein